MSILVKKLETGFGPIIENLIQDGLSKFICDLADDQLQQDPSLSLEQLKDIYEGAYPEDARWKLGFDACPRAYRCSPFSLPGKKLPFNCS